MQLVLCSWALKRMGVFPFISGLDSPCHLCPDDPGPDPGVRASVHAPRQWFPLDCSHGPFAEPQGGISQSRMGAQSWPWNVASALVQSRQASAAINQSTHAHTHSNMIQLNAAHTPIDAKVGGHLHLFAGGQGEIFEVCVCN